MSKCEQNKGTLLHIITTSLLAVFYIPYAVFCFLCLMVSEVALVATNDLIIAGAYIIAYTGLFTALTAHIFLVISFILYSKGHRKKSYLIRFLPVINMLAAFFIDLILETIAKV